MRDILNKKHTGCGGTFKEINIWEDIACDKCGQGTERFIYTKKEQEERKDAFIVRLQDRVQELEDKLENIHNMAGG